MLGGNNSMPKKRIYAYDFIRAFAIVMVVAVHCVPDGPSNAAHIYAAFMKALLFPCNAIFFVMSGIFNVKASYLDNPRRYYYHKVRNILIPALIYMFIYTVYDMVRQPGPLHMELLPETYGINAFSSYTNGIFWFVMDIFVMLLVAPFFALSFENIDSKTAKTFFVMFIVFSGLNLVGICLGTGFGWPWPLATFFTLFLLGPAANRIVIRHRGALISILFSCVAISTILILVGVPHHPVNDNTPFYFVAGVSLFLLLKEWGFKLKENKAIKLISKYSFSIYMCHLMALPYISSVMPQMTKPLAHITLTAVTLVAALLISTFVDSLIVKPIQKLSDRIYTIGCKNKQYAN